MRATPRPALGGGTGRLGGMLPDPDDALVVSAGSRVVSLDPGTLEPIDTWAFDAPVQGLGTAPRELLVAVPGAVHALRGDAGHTLILAPVVDELAHVNVLER